jgi:hypothetical protein
LLFDFETVHSLEVEPGGSLYPGGPGEPCPTAAFRLDFSFVSYYILITIIILAG